MLNEGMSLDSRVREQINHKINFDEVKELYSSDRLCNSRFVEEFDYQTNSTIQVERKKIKPEVLEMIDETDSQILIFLIKEYVLSIADVLNFVKSHESVKVSQELLDNLLQRRSISARDVFNICIDKCDTKMTYQTFIKAIPSYNSTNISTALVVDMAKYINNGGRQLIIPNDSEVQDFLSNYNNRLKPVFKVTFDDLCRLVASGSVSDIPSSFCEYKITGEPFSSLMNYNHIDITEGKEVSGHYGSVFEKNREAIQNRADEIIDFFEKNPEIALILTTVGALDNLLFKVEDFPGLCDILKEIEDRGLFLYFDVLLRASDGLFKDRIDLVVPYLDRYNNLLDEALIRRFIKYNGASEEEIRKEEGKVGMDNYVVSKVTDTVFKAQIINGRTDTTIYDEKKREKLTDLEIPLYRSVGIEQLFSYWKSKELPRSVWEGHKDSDAEPGSLLTFWSDVPISGLPNSSFAVFETNKSLLQPFPKYLWKGKMRFLTQDVGYDIDDFDIHVSSIDEYYIGDRIKESQCKEPRIFEDEKTFLIRFLRFCATELGTEDYKQILSNYSTKKYDDADPAGVRSNSEYTINNIIYSMYGDMSLVPLDVIESNGLSLYSGQEYNKNILREIASFCTWALTLETIDKFDNLLLTSPHSFYRSPSYKGDITFKSSR